MNEDEKTILLIEITKEKEHIFENFKKCVINGCKLSDENISKLKQKGIQNVENFIHSDGRIRFWRFVEDPQIKENDIILFYYSNILYIFETSNIIEDNYNYELKNYEILKCPKPGPGHLPYAVLLKIKNIIYNSSRVNEIINRVKGFGETIKEDYMYKCKFKSKNDIIEKMFKIDLTDYIKSKGYKFPDYLIAQFYTALKTKGFVILSGLSGTGKTKIALNFVRLLSSSANKDIKKIIELLYYMPKVVKFYYSEEIGKIRKVIEQKGFAVRYIDYNERIKKYFEGIKDETSALLWVYSGNDGKVVMCLYVIDIKECSYRNLPDDWKDRLGWVEDVYGKDAITSIIDEKKFYIKIKYIWPIDEDVGNFIDLENGNNVLADNQYLSSKKILKVKSPERLNPLKQANYVFLSVRPDWRDSKPLLGYYNPLDKKYYKTSLLELILRAKEDYEKDKEKAMPYFVILDEMNLAHVEYYFSDFLSVLESGRDKDGFTRESIKLHNVDEVERDQRIPKEIKLPPNLYVIGTVNIDETTYMFSPKVLDRAFTIEFHDVDLDNYPSETIDLDSTTLRDLIIEDLRNNDNFLTYSNKKIINTALQEFKSSEYWEILQNLNKALEPYDLHFGYRVVDEIALFFKNAKESQEKGIITFENDDEIFDSALLMKILPKFHGNIKKLEKPLLIVLKVAKDGKLDYSDIGKDKNELFRDLFKDTYTQNQQLDKSEVIINELNKLDNYRFKHTAKKVLRMLRQLYEVGFASFS